MVCESQTPKQGIPRDLAGAFRRQIGPFVNEDMQSTLGLHPWRPALYGYGEDCALIECNKFALAGERPLSPS